MTPEGRVKKHLKARVLALGGRIRYLRWLGRRSALDTLIWWPVAGGQAKPNMAFVEVKRADGEYQPGQEREIERLRADGFLAFTVRNERDVEMVVDILRPLFDCTQPIDC